MKRLFPAFIAVFFFSTCLVLYHSRLADVRPNLDLDTFIQMYWKGDPAYLNDNEGGSHWRVHFSPLLLPLLCLRGAPSSLIGWVLLALNVGALTLGGLLLYGMAADLLQRRGVALLVEAAYFLCPASWGIALSGFHEMSFAVPILIAFFWLLARGKLPWAFLCAMGLCLLRADLCLTAGGCGLALWLTASRGERWKTALLTVFCSLLIFLIALGVMKSFGGGVMSHAARFQNFSLSWEKVSYPALLLLTTLLLPFASPATLLPGLPQLAINLASSYQGHWSLLTHYYAPVVACAFAGVVLSLVKMRRKFNPVIVVGIIAALQLGWLLGAGAPLVNHLHPQRADYRTPLTPAEISLLHEIKREIGDESIACSWTLTPLFAGRKQYFSALHFVDTLRAGDYRYLLLDMQNLPPFQGSVSASEFIELIRNKYRLLHGRNGERLLLYELNR